MKLSKTFFTLSLLVLFLTSCSKDDDGDGRPKAGTTRIVTQDVEYYSGLIEDTTSWATWPVAKFPVDQYAVKYSVKLIKTGAVYTWNSDEDTGGLYLPFQSTNGIKDGYFYIGLDRTWCAGCTEVDPSWQANYMAFFGTNNQVEITFFY